jgi:HEAT repeat protein
MPQTDETFEPGEVMSEFFHEDELAVGDVIRIWTDNLPYTIGEKGWLPQFWWSQVLDSSESEVFLKDLKNGKEYEHSISKNAPYGVRGYKHPNPRRFLDPRPPVTSALQEPAPIAETVPTPASTQSSHRISEAIGVVEESYLARYDEVRQAQFDAALDQIAAEGELGVETLIERLEAGTHIVGNKLSLRNWGDLAWNEFIKKARIAEKLGRIEAESAAPAMRALTRAYSDVQQYNQIVRPSTACALNDLDTKTGTQHLPATLGELIGIFRTGPDEHRHVVREIILEIHKKVGGTVVNVLSKALADDPDDNVRMYAALILGRCGDVAAMNVLLHALADPSVAVQQNSAAAVGLIGDACAVDALIEALRNSDWGVRNNAAVSLGRIGDRRAVNALTEALQDADTNVRKMAEWALNAIEEEGASKP